MWKQSGRRFGARWRNSRVYLPLGSTNLNAAKLVRTLPPCAFHGIFKWCYFPLLFISTLCLVCTTSHCFTVPFAQVTH